MSTIKIIFYIYQSGGWDDGLETHLMNRGLTLHVRGSAKQEPFDIDRDSLCKNDLTAILYNINILYMKKIFSIHRHFQYPI